MAPLPRALAAVMVAGLTNWLHSLIERLGIAGSLSLIYGVADRLPDLKLVDNTGEIQVRCRRHSHVSDGLQSVVLSVLNIDY